MSGSLSSPIAGDNPCGVDLRDSTELFVLREVARGKAETQFSEARDPDWNDLRKRCEVFLQQSKDIEVFTIYILSRLQTDGFWGMADALEGLTQSIISFWPQIYPLLDEGDPTERLNLLCGLAMPLGSFQDPLRFIERLRLKSLIHSARAGSLNLDEIESRLARTDVDKDITEAELRGFLADVDPSVTAGIRNSLEKVLVLIRALEDFTDEALGSSSSFSWKSLEDVLNTQLSIYSRFAAIEEVVEVLTPAASSPPEVATPAVAVPVKAIGVISFGSISSRDDVVNMLDSICAYYKLNEPASPVPLLLQRAQALVGRNFAELMEDLIPGSTPQISLLPQMQPVN